MIHPTIFIWHQEHPFNTHAEERESHKLNLAQLQSMQNLLSRIANEKLTMVPTPETPSDYFQKQEYLRGQMDIVRYLLELHFVATETT